MSPSSTYPLSLHDALPIFRNDDDPAADFEAQKAFTPWSSLWNLTGAPAISLPLHWASVEDDGPELPFGVLIGARSEEHTSELQSRGHLVCRLLLEKKKKNT